jgi:hypothetical protein
MIKGEGFEVEFHTGNGRLWAPVEFFATSIAQDNRGQVGLVLITFAVVDGELRAVNGRVRKLGFATASIPHD